MKSAREYSDAIMNQIPPGYRFLGMREAIEHEAILLNDNEEENGIRN